MQAFFTSGARKMQLICSSICSMPQPESHPMRTRLLLPTLLSILCNGCAVVAVADAAVTVAATTVKVGAAVVGTTVDVAAAGVKAVTGSSDDKE